MSVRIAGGERRSYVSKDAGGERRSYVSKDCWRGEA